MTYNPLNSKIQRTRQFIEASWNAIGHALQAQGATKLSKLSAELKAFVQALPEALGVGEQFDNNCLYSLVNRRNGLKNGGLK